ncbi:hypothetical protein GQ53DRAFT_742000 [Thozetella sp. PMI_491]|nr:hypothetical protein GQ53DRAFT_742000 [Thozetella sp. PMI_491]
MKMHNEKTASLPLSRNDSAGYKHVARIIHGIVVAIVACLSFILFRWVYAASIAVVGSWSQAPSVPSTASTTHGAGAFDWESITPSRELTYVPCDSGYQCARLLLPMDWTAPEERQWDHTVAIAVMKLPANVSTITDPRYGGEIYVNPGGPGASAISFLKHRSGYLDEILNTESRVFDLVAFDPRGIVHSTPRFSCFQEGNVQGRGVLAMTEGAYGWSDEALPAVWARGEAFNRMCDPGNETTDQALIKSHISTASVARDLLGIVEKAGELRVARLQEELASSDQIEMRLDSEHLSRLAYRPGQEKLQYWGFSYGTTLGGYFASMFPDRIERMVLDGNADLDDWATGRWTGFLNNSDASFRTLYGACFAAGKDKCALFHPDGPDAIEYDVLSTLEQLKTSPIPVWEEGMRYPEVLTYEKVIETLFMATYAPYARFPPLAEGLASMKHRHNMSISSIRGFLPSQGVRCSNDSCGSIDCAEEDSGAWYHEFNVAVSCSDTDTSLRNRTFSQFREWAHFLQTQSKLFGGFFASDSTMSCHEWSAPPKYRFDGPFGGRTHHPLMFVANKLDPVSPVDNAEKMAEVFDGAVILSTNAGGHCSPSAPSVCTALHIREYFVTGKLPAPGTVCEVDYPLFEEPLQSRDSEGKKGSLLSAIQAAAKSDMIPNRLLARYKIPSL